MSNATTPRQTRALRSVRLASVAQTESHIVLAINELPSFIAAEAALAPLVNPFIVRPPTPSPPRGMPGAWPDSPSGAILPIAYKIAPVPLAQARVNAPSGRYGVPPSSSASSAFDPGATPTPLNRNDRAGPLRPLPLAPTVSRALKRRQATKTDAEQVKPATGGEEAQIALQDSRGLSSLVSAHVTSDLLGLVVPSPAGMLVGGTFPYIEDVMKRINFVHNSRFIVLRSLHSGALLDTNPSALSVLSQRYHDKLLAEPSVPINPVRLRALYEDRIIWRRWDQQACVGYIHHIRELEAGLRLWAAVPSVPQSVRTAGVKLFLALCHLGLDKIGAWTFDEVLAVLRICVQMARIESDCAVDFLSRDQRWFKLFTPTLSDHPLQPLDV